MQTKIKQLRALREALVKHSGSKGEIDLVRGLVAVAKNRLV